MSKKRKTYNAEFKAKIVLELLKEELTVAQISSKYEITAKSLIDWKKQFLANVWHLMLLVQLKPTKMK